MFAKGLSNQRGTVYSRPFGCSIRRPKQLRIQHYLDGFHVVEDTPQSDPQSTGPTPGCNGWRRRRTSVKSWLVVASTRTSISGVGCLDWSHFEALAVFDGCEVKAGQSIRRKAQVHTAPGRQTEAEDEVAGRGFCGRLAEGHADVFPNGDVLACSLFAFLITACCNYIMVPFISSPKWAEEPPSA